MGAIKEFKEKLEKSQTEIDLFEKDEKKKHRIFVILVSVGSSIFVVFCVFLIIALTIGLKRYRSTLD